MNDFPKNTFLKKIGILGGSFDPIHKGHISMAVHAYEQYALDCIWLIPNGHAPHKNEDKMADAVHRLAMCELVAKKYDFIETCDIEIMSEEYSYTYLTMQKLTAMYPEYEFYFIMGADSLDYFDKWRHPEIISSLCKILVVNRDEFTVEDLNDKIMRLNNLFCADVRIVHCPKVDVSSTEIRNGKKLEELLPEVNDYIINNHLYSFSLSGILDKLKNRLDSKRYRHTVGVMYTAASLAMAYSHSIEQSMLAGLLHDCAKCMSLEEMKDICKAHKFEISVYEEESRELLHSKVGAILAQEEYYISDTDILHAIKVHTTGEPGMSTLDKIIFIADYIEPGRDKAQNLAYIRKLAFEDLDTCMAQILYDTLSYLKTKSYPIDPMTEQTYSFYQESRKEIE